MKAHQWILSAIALISSAAIGRSAEMPLSASEIFARLQDGGNVILWRHMRTDGHGDQLRNASIRDGDHEAFFADCSRQRMLDDEGKHDAIIVGKAIRRLKISVAAVWTSPYCRTRDSASLIFGGGKIRRSDDLQTTCFASPKAVVSRKEALLKMLAKPPKFGNAALMTHSCNIKSAVKPIIAWCGIEPTDFRQGDAIVFRPDGGSQLRPIGCLRVADWKSVF